MNILHICGYYNGSTVHKELFCRLDSLGIKQTVYSAVQASSKIIGANEFNGEYVSFVSAPILRIWHRARLLAKSSTIFQDLDSRLNVINYDVINATTTFSDGVVAYRLHKKYGIPYFITVRNTDLNDFMRFPQWWGILRKTVKGASKVIFITPIMKERFLSHLSLIGLAEEIAAKSIVQPNGIDSYWLNHLDIKEHNDHSVIYVGKFDHNKNVLRLVKAAKSLRDEIPDIHLHLIGGGGGQESAILTEVLKCSEWVHYYGKIYDKDQLRQIYSQNSVFAMPSHHETFGLVYLEAMSQGLTVLCTKGEGIDGVFAKKIGEFVNSYSIQSIKKALRDLLIHKNQYASLSKNDISSFDWGLIALRYQALFSGETD